MKKTERERERLRTISFSWRTKQPRSKRSRVICGLQGRWAWCCCWRWSCWMRSVPKSPEVSLLRSSSSIFCIAGSEHNSKTLSIDVWHSTRMFWSCWMRASSEEENSVIVFGFRLRVFGKRTKFSVVEMKSLSACSFVSDEPRNWGVSLFISRVRFLLCVGESGVAWRDDDDGEDDNVSLTEIVFFSFIEECIDWCLENGSISRWLKNENKTAPLRLIPSQPQSVEMRSVKSNTIVFVLWCANGRGSFSLQFSNILTQQNKTPKFLLFD